MKLEKTPTAGSDRRALLVAFNMIIDRLKAVMMACWFLAHGQDQSDQDWYGQELVILVSPGMTLTKFRNFDKKIV